MDLTADGENAWTIRPIRSGDLDEVVEVWRRAGLPYRPYGRDAPAALAAQLEAMSETYLGAFDGDKLIGVVLGTHDHRKGWINRLAVLPEYRRRGVARDLIRACERVLAHKGIGIVAALTETENAASAETFLALGYQEYPVRYFRRLLKPEG